MITFDDLAEAAKTLARYFDHGAGGWPSHDGTGQEFCTTTGAAPRTGLRD